MDQPIFGAKHCLRNVDHLIFGLKKQKKEYIIIFLYQNFYKEVII